MCTNGVNTAQLEQMIDMVDAHVALERRMAHNLAHTADDAGFEACHEELHKASAMLDEVRAILDAAKAALEDAAHAGAPTVDVHLV